MISLSSSHNSKSTLTPCIWIFLIYGSLDVFQSKPPFVYTSGGTFTLILLNYTNPLNLLSSGHCCTPGQLPIKLNSTLSRCPSPCTPSIPLFRVCLKNYQISIDPNGPCYIGEAESQSASGMPIEWDFGFGFRWVGTFSLILEAWHLQPTTTTTTSDSSANPIQTNTINTFQQQQDTDTALSPPRSLLFRHSSQQWLTISPTFRHRSFTTPTGITVHLKYRVQCLPHYYGDECNRYCKPRDDKFGHYACSENGDVVCNNGWRGEYCMEATCSPPCTHGTCTAPNTCTCALGYSGPSCSNCQPYPGCKHGTCTTPWQCECEEGWGGLFCNQDLNYCTNHRPCKNGGTCFNTGQGSYTCSCAIGFGGVDCGRVGDSTPNQLSCYCHGRGKCNSDGKCECDEGWGGAECEEEEIRNVNGLYVRPCDEKKGWRCGGGGTCSLGNCICPPGLLPPNCTTPFCTQNSICPISSTCNELKKTCENCPMGLKGTYCNETININQQQQQQQLPCPCLNGGSCNSNNNNNNTILCICPPTHTGPLCTFPNSTYTLSLLKELSSELSTEHIVLVVIASVATPLLIILSIGVVLIMKRKRERERLREEEVVEGQNRENRKKMEGENNDGIDSSVMINSKEINLWRENQLIAQQQNQQNTQINQSGQRGGMGMGQGQGSISGQQLLCHQVSTTPPNILPPPPPPNNSTPSYHLLIPPPINSNSSILTNSSSNNLSSHSLLNNLNNYSTSGIKNNYNYQSINSQQNTNNVQQLQQQQQQQQQRIT